MKLNDTTKLDDILKEYSFLVNFLSKLSPKYKKLKNPVMRKTMRKVAAIKMVAKIGGIETKTLIREIKEEIRRKAGKNQEHHRTRFIQSKKGDIEGNHP